MGCRAATREAFPRLGERHPMRRAVNEPATDRFLQHPDLMGEGGLGDLETGCSAAECSSSASTQNPSVYLSLA